jgi:HEAT repeat protein
MRYFILIVGAWFGLLASGGILAAQNKPKEKEPDKEREKDHEITEIGGKKLAQWIAEIRHPTDAAIRDYAIRTVPLFGKSARKAVKALINELRDPDASLRVNAAISLGLIGMDEGDLAEGVSALGRVVTTDPQINVRYQAALTLGKLGADAKAASPKLRVALVDPYNWELRQAAALALAGTGWELKETQPNSPQQAIWVAEPKTVAALVSAAKTDKCAKVRLQALTSLLYLGMPVDPKDLQNEKTALHLVLKDPDPTVGIWARVALMRIDKVSELYLKDISQLLKHADVSVRTNAAQALAAIGPSSRSRVQDLLRALNDKEPLVLIAVIAALVQIGEDSEEVRGALQRLIDGTKDEGQKVFVTKALEQLKLKAEELRKGELLAPKGPDPKAPKKKTP